MTFVARISLALLTLGSLSPVLSSASEQLYSSTEGSLCISSEFAETHSGCNRLCCGALCNLNQRCQAFSLADGPCQLFVFDKCSKSVRDCSCSRRGQVFVRQQPGLEAGALCPSGYGMEQCGVKYRLHSGIGTWWPSRQKCESESGLVIMADVTSASEMSHVNSIYSNFSVGRSFWLGGYQPTGSPEPAGGWYWVECNATVSAALWASGQPNDVGHIENVVSRDHSRANLTDSPESYTTTDVLCECASPFS